MSFRHLLTNRDDSDKRWLAMSGESIFITGGTGLFGRWFVSALLDANDRLGTGIQATILTRNPAAFLKSLGEDAKNHALTLLQGDVQDFKFVQEKFSRIMHMATTSAHETFAGENALAKFHLLLQGTERLLQFADVCDATKVLFTSSGVAYGAYPDHLQFVSERYPGSPLSTDPLTALGQGKRAAEFLCAAYAHQHQFEFTIARCFSFVGAALPLDIHYAIGNFIRDALYAECITVKGDGSPMRSFLYLGDLVHWLLALLVDGKSATIYNVGSDEAISIVDLANKVRDLLATDKPVQVLGDASHNVGNFTRNWYVPDISLAKQHLALKVWTPLNEAILSTARNIDSF